MASRCGLKIHGLQQGNKIAVFDIKVSFKMDIKGIQKGQLVKTSGFVFKVN